MSGDVAVSDVVGKWKPGIQNLCNPPAPEPCDCGYVGLWEHRWVYIWYDEPGHKRSDRTARRDMKRGFPARVNDEGWWVVGGFDERCPGCGDLERFDIDANFVRRHQEHARVVQFVDFGGRA